MWWCCMARDADALARKLVVARDLIDDILHELVVPQSQPEAQGCQHPANRREDLTTMGVSGEHWRCRECGYRYPEDAGMEAVDGR